MEEYITFNFSKDYNGVFRDIVSKDTDGLENLKVSELIEGKQVEYKLDDSAEKGAVGKYKKLNYKNAYNVEIYWPSVASDTKTFKLNYTIKNVAKRYQDNAEFYFNFIGPDNNTYIENLTVRIRIPDIEENEIKDLFTRVLVKENVKKLDQETVEVIVENLGRNREVALRLIFPNEFIKNSDKYIQEEIMRRTLTEESIHQRKIKMISIFNDISLILSGLGLLFLLYSSLKIRTKSHRYIKSDVEKYMNMRTPATVGLLTSSEMEIQLHLKKLKFIQSLNIKI